MVKKKKLSRSTKRMMMMFSFFSFKEKLKWKCDLYGKKLIIVDERDVAGARNILIKNIILN